MDTCHATDRGARILALDLVDQTPADLRLRPHLPVPRCHSALHEDFVRRSNHAGHRHRTYVDVALSAHGVGRTVVARAGCFCGHRWNDDGGADARSPDSFHRHHAHFALGAGGSDWDSGRCHFLGHCRTSCTSGAGSHADRRHTWFRSRNGILVATTAVLLELQPVNPNDSGARPRGADEFVRHKYGGQAPVLLRGIGCSCACLCDRRASSKNGYRPQHHRSA